MKYIIDEALAQRIIDYCHLRCETNIPDRLLASKIEPMSHEQIMELADKYADSVIGDYLNETHTTPSKSRAAIKSAIEELEAKLKAEQEAHEAWQHQHLIDDGNQCRRIRELEAKLEPRKSFGERYPRNPNATCKCEHWECCPECHPTALAEWSKA